MQARIIAANASPVGFVHLLARQYGEAAEITRTEFLQEGLRAATGYNITIAGTAPQVADHMEEIFAATGRRGGFMTQISQGGPRAVPVNIIDLLVPELRRRGLFRTVYEGRTLRENLSFNPWSVRAAISCDGLVRLRNDASGTARSGLHEFTVWQQLRRDRAKCERRGLVRHDIGPGAHLVLQTRTRLLNGELEMYSGDDGRAFSLRLRPKQRQRTARLLDRPRYQLPPF